MTRYPLEIFWSEEDKGFIAEARDLPGCSAWGATEVNAAREAQRAIAAWLEAARAALLGVSVRTLQEWEQGRRAPSGAARTLLLIAAKNPQALLEVA